MYGAIDIFKIEFKIKVEDDEASDKALSSIFTRKDEFNAFQPSFLCYS